ncbi:ras association domain-containing protein 6-like [Daphnia pulicaria]|uniref:ras association domain-containing protein 6-like n=1 Tax=Daphnia pulicaria TaxID=35523 RepID=UPI001EEACE10|nr:ras association domain-containing protein 6-like [Daphnia pulicaria]
MWSCHKCGKPVFFAERKQSMGYDWHPDCLKCEECGKILKPGQHAEHKGVSYCHVPCYGALFGPQLFGHGTRVESHKSFGKIENKSYGGITRTHLETTIKSYNHYHDVHGGSGGIKSREVNGRLVLEGVLRLYWGVQSAIQLKEDDDQRLPSNGAEEKITQRKVSSSLGYQNANMSSFDESDSDDDSLSENSSVISAFSPAVNGSGYEKKVSLNSESNDVSKFNTVPSKLDPKQLGRDELDELIQVEREWKDHEKPYSTLPNKISLSPSEVCPTVIEESSSKASVVEDATSPTKSTALRRRPGRRFDKTKLRRRCSINGHYYNRETSVFTPPYGSTMSVWTTSLVNTQEVINMLLDKYRVECPASNFSLFVVKDNGERRRVKEDEYPLLLRVMQGPDESVAKLFLVESEGEGSHEVSAAVAQFLRLSDFELQSILRLYCEEEEREVQSIKNKHRELKRRIKKRMQELKVKL